MPPRPAGAARKNQSGNRHENGLVLPGKKIPKQKSNGHLNGNHGLNGHQQSPQRQQQPQPPAAARPRSSPGPAPAEHQQQPQQQQPFSSMAATVGANNTNNGVNGTVDGPGGVVSNGLAQGDVYDKADASLSNGSTTPADSSAAANGGGGGGGSGLISGAPNKFEDHACRHAHGSKKGHASRTVNPFVLAATILKACPMSDTIAILIFLLQLPPIVLTLVQFLYASMTFMLPAGMSSGSLTYNFDIFQGPAGTPSLGTMLAMDGFCLLLWALFTWNWAQHFAIDLAHVQVAIALGAGSSGDSGRINALCLSVVLIVHLFRSKGVQNFVIGYLFSYKLVSPDTLSRLASLIPEELRSKDVTEDPGWIRSLLAVHILAQAATAIARRSMAQNRSPPRAKSGKRTDTEAFAGSQAAQADSSALESAPNLSSAAVPEGSALSSSNSPSSRDTRERISSAKKRRRQANEARRTQPFWAALASTKLTVTREYERSRNGHWYSPTLPIAEDDVDGGSADDGLIWITNVDGSTIKFAASDFFPLDDGIGNYDNSFVEAETDRPFYVRVNGAQWAPVTLDKVPENSNDGALVHWRGQISGLAPDCAYTCSFVRSDTKQEICVMSVKTPPAPDAEQAVVAPSVSPSPRQSLRPSSPTTTIRNSIVNAEAKLNERRARLKKSKNDHKVNVAKVKKELDNFSHRLNSGGDDSRQKQRSLQLERTIRQTEEATTAMETQLNNMEKIPEEEMQEYNALKADFEREMENVKTLKSELEAARTASNRDVSSLENELVSIVQKRERLQSRRSRLTEQHDRITAANSQGMNERERRAAEQLAKEREHAKIEGTFYEQISNITKSVQDLQMRTTQLSQQASTMEQIHQQQQQQLIMDTGPLTPEGELPGTNLQHTESGLSTMHVAGTTMSPESQPNMGYPLGPSFNPVDATTVGGPQPSSTMSPLAPAAAALSSEKSQSQTHLPSYPLPNTHSLPEQPYYDRPMSKYSGRSVLAAEHHNRSPPTATDAAGPQTGAAHDSPGMIGRSLITQFDRADSRGSGSAGVGSGSGSGSGGSPRSLREKMARS